MSPTSPKQFQAKTLFGSGIVRLWDDYAAEKAKNAKAFETALERELKKLEDRYCVFQTRRSVAASLKR